VKLAGSDTHWHACNQSGPSSIPFEELGYARYYEDCPGLRTRDWPDPRIPRGPSASP
jgi:hypothetical protein